MFSGYGSSEDMSAMQMQQYYHNGGGGMQYAQQAPPSPVAAAASRRRQNNPYSSSKPVVMVKANSASTPVMSPTAMAISTPLRQASASAFVPATVIIDPLALPAPSSMRQQQAQITQQQQATGTASSSASSTGSIAPLAMPAPASVLSAIQHQQQQVMAVEPVLASLNSSAITVSAAAANAAAAATGPSPYSGLTGEEMLGDLTARTPAELLQLARTANGSSMLQTAIKTDARCATLLWGHFSAGPALGELMLDAHGGYVVRCLLDTVPRASAQAVCDAISRDKRLAYSLCTHSLHTRRLVQGIMEAHDPDFLAAVLAEMCNEIARTQQGCIVMQRALDHSSAAPRAALVDAIAKHLGDFAADPFANYVVQYLLDSAPREEVVPLLWAALRGKVVALSCNKFASNVIEKFLTLADPQSQHELIVELYTSSPDALCHVMQDSFGNYIVQATIARSTFADLTFIDTQLRPILEHVPYGSKIAARLDRRLNPNHHHQHGGGHHQQQYHRGAGGNNAYAAAGVYANNSAAQQQQQGASMMMMQQQQQQQYLPRGGPRGGPRGQHNGMQYQQQMMMVQQQQQQQQQQLSIPAPLHAQQQQHQQQQYHHVMLQQQQAAPMTYYVTPSTAAW